MVLSINDHFDKKFYRLYNDGYSNGKKVKKISITFENNKEFLHESPSDVDLNPDR